MPHGANDYFVKQGHDELLSFQTHPTMQIQQAGLTTKRKQKDGESQETDPVRAKTPLEDAKEGHDASEVCLAIQSAPLCALNGAGDDDMFLIRRGALWRNTRRRHETSEARVPGPANLPPRSKVLWRGGDFPAAGASRQSAYAPTPGRRRQHAWPGTAAAQAGLGHPHRDAPRAAAR